MNKAIKSRKCFRLLAGAILIAALPLWAGTPSVFFGETEHDFGIAGERKNLTHTFVFENRGTGTLIIERISAG